jgi:hypothetical protein
VNSDQYVDDILNPFFNHLTAEEDNMDIFSKITLQHILLMHPWSQYGTCLKTIISRGLWPPRSPNLSFGDFYLWGNLKGKLYKNNPHSKKALQNEITRVTGSITVDELQKVSQNLFRCLGDVRHV